MTKIFISLETGVRTIYQLYILTSINISYSLFTEAASIINQRIHEVVRCHPAGGASSARDVILQYVGELLGKFIVIQTID